jgi:GTP-binding protein HflX
MEPARTKAILVDLIHPRMLKRHSEERLRELEELVNTYGGIVVVKSYQRRFAPHPRTFIGPGKAENIAREGAGLGAELLIVNDVLKAPQIYNLEQMLRPSGIKVWDRIDLILKIFSKHAQTTEARLEIELASIRHMGPRIFGMGMELSRQAGGIGTVGIGETNTEIMRRHLRNQEQKIRQRLEQYEAVREGHRKHRRRNNFKTISLVGYTNAGKTSLLNALTGRREYVADKLFATLDTRVGQLFLPRLTQSVLLSDTIGFIKHLPPELIHAFRSTLSEVTEADLLLHVIDVNDVMLASKIHVVDQILQELEADMKPQIYVFNKAEVCPPSKVESLARRHIDRSPVFVSAAEGHGLPQLVSAIEEVVRSL